MQVTVYNCRAFDEKELFIEYAKEIGIELVLCADAPDLENVALCKGSRCVDVITSKVDAPLIRAFQENGIEYISTRTIGYDHIDVEAAQSCALWTGWCSRLYGYADSYVYS